MNYVSHDNLTKLIIDAGIIIDLNTDFMYKYDTTSLYTLEGEKVIYVEENGDVIYVKEKRKIATLYNKGEITRKEKGKEVVVGNIPIEIVAQNRSYKYLPDEISEYKENYTFIISVVLLSIICSVLAILRVFTAYKAYVFMVVISLAVSVINFSKTKNEDFPKVILTNVAGTLLIFILGSIFLAPAGAVNFLLDFLVIIYIIAMSTVLGVSLYYKL